jgi:hypothetical protein
MCARLPQPQTDFTTGSGEDLPFLQIHSTAQLELFRSVITAGSSALRSATLINGGAAVALLAFLGSPNAKNQQAAFALSLAIFAFGVFAASAAEGLRYLTQKMGSDARRMKVNPTEDDLRCANRFNWASIAFAAVSILSFLVGAAFSVKGILRQIG